MSLLSIAPAEPLPRPGTAARKELSNRAAQLYAQGSSTHEVAQALGLAYSTTRRLLLAAGVEFRAVGGAHNFHWYQEYLARQQQAGGAE
jgi:hypothetical protein